jgi:hypothetical protein
MSPKAFARTELRKICKRLERVKDGKRSFALEDAAEAAGGLVARGWLCPADVSRGLLAACEVNGLAEVDSSWAMKEVIRTGLERGLKHPHPDLQSDRWDRVLEPVRGVVRYYDEEKNQPIERISVQALLAHLNIPVAKRTPAHLKRLGDTMARLGWIRSTNGLRFNGKLKRGYWRVRPGDASREDKGAA